MSTATSSTPPLAKSLASTDKKTRDKAIKNLSVFLSDSTRDVISKPDMDKLWKGIFYCFWMSDKPLVQQALASELAEIVLTITTFPSSLFFLRGFWEATVREWNGIDRLRIDKYYMLVRRFVNATFRLLIRTEWDQTSCDEYNDILVKEGGPLCPTDIKVPASLAYHLADIYVEELDKVMGRADSHPLPAPLGTLIDPFIMFSARTPSSVTYDRINSALFEPLLSALSPPSSNDRPPSAKRIKLDTDPATFPHLLKNSCFKNPKLEGNIAGVELNKNLLRRVFEVASRPETRDSNRRKMYALWKEGIDDKDDDE
ncbi:rRNA processing protein RRP1 [Laccaria bicolor S238N-H82]|uniref:Predicted protein n=1 Tax=Laccaria bicolor (strain S238N-H82 / ATCC MYA-4686) TaxID=486041 RepID=B0CRD5_LACBS|nr:rRNA processing protein RRP1 [Laccaria bicolor S238N-H82]EDR15800.1 predicted protein [Laccaria bicolor S238N-H82]|eukprot:XP_001874008.1 rRNA processing protein RRP1 [Laccaria bicolor S238N-H82]